jgi:hypothetical protein
LKMMGIAALHPSDGPVICLSDSGQFNTVEPTIARLARLTEPASGTIGSPGR